MKIYRTDKGGIGLWKLSGVVDRNDAFLLLHSLRESEESGRGCFIIDFENVKHVDYRAFNVLEDGFPEGARVLLSGLSDYILDIFAFVTKRNVISVYPDWKKALRYLVVQRGKLGSALAAGSAFSK
jgi:hypothetical protein